MLVAIEDYELYNNGILLCKWFDLEVANIEYIEKTIKELKYDYYGYSSELELFVADYEGEFSEYMKNSESLEFALDLQNDLEMLEDEEKIKTSLLVNNYLCSNVKEAYRKLDDLICTGESDFSEIAYNYIEESGALENMPENLKGYFDYESFGRDLEIEMSYIMDENGIIWEYVG